MVLLDGDREFWSRQIKEHMKLINLYMQDEIVKDRALELYGRWQLEPQLTDLEVISLLDESLDFQNEILSDLNDRRWLGSMFPKWIIHINNETEYTIDKVAGNDISDEEELLFWSDLIEDHSRLDMSMIDPSELDAIRDATDIYEGIQRVIDEYKLSPEMGFFIELTIKYMDKLYEFHQSANEHPPKSIIHPLLLEHVMVEERYGKIILDIINNK